MWRLGLLILISYVGDLVVDEDAKKIKLPLRKCCLFHELLEVDGSLTAILIDDNKAELKDEGIEEFLCSSLRSKNAIDSGEHPRPKLKTLRESMFLKRKYPELLSLK